MYLADALRLFNLKPGCNKDEIKKRFRELTKKYHPDVYEHGDMMIKMINDANDVLKTYRGESIPGFEDSGNTSQDLREKIDAVKQLPGVVVKASGIMLYVSGNTYQHREELKRNGFMWSQNRKEWYYRKGFVPRKGNYQKSRLSLEERDRKYGVTLIADNSQNRQLPSRVKMLS